METKTIKTIEKPDTSLLQPTLEAQIVLANRRLALKVHEVVFLEAKAAPQEAEVLLLAGKE